MMTKVITIAGMIGVGKSSLTQLIADKYGALAKYETIPPILSRWYGDDAVTQSHERIPFLTQLTFLTSRMNMLHEVLTDDKHPFAILDRSIYEDKLFARLKFEEGVISDSEWEVYLNLIEAMHRECDLIPQKSPHVTFYIRTSFGKALERIIKRGRPEEVQNLEKNYDWFKLLWSHYDDYMFNEYNFSKVIVIDGDLYDFVDNAEHRETVMNIVHAALVEAEVIKEEK